MSKKKDYKFSYQNSGVNIDLGNEIVNEIKPLAKSTISSEVIGGIGGFGAIFKLNLKKYKNPLLVSATDGVGTKLLIAEKLNNYESIGIDLVAMSVNDIVVQGAKPLFFLDYIAIDKINKNKILNIIKGITLGCKNAGCSLVGGETAELPGVYSKNKFDLAGFGVGIVEKKSLLPKKNIIKGDVILGLPSNGLHSNGYSLIRQIMREKKISYNSTFSYKKTFGTELLKPTKIYVKPILEILTKCKVKAIAHITGGGITENIKRVIPENRGVIFEKKKFDLEKKGSIFYWLKNSCKISEKELLKTFNCGIGMMIISNHLEASHIISLCKKLKQPVKVVGKVTVGNNVNFN